MEYSVSGVVQLLRETANPMIPPRMQVRFRDNNREGAAIGVIMVGSQSVMEISHVLRHESIRPEGQEINC